MGGELNRYQEHQWLREVISHMTELRVQRKD